MAAEELFSAPSDLTLATDADLTELETRAVAEFNRINSDDAQPVTEEALQEHMSYAYRLTEDLDRIRGELRVREVRAKEQAAIQQARVANQLSQLEARVNGAPAAQAAAEAAPAIDVEAIAAAAARGVTAGMAQLMMDRRGGTVRPDEIARRATASLAETAAHAPAPQVPNQRLAVTASVDIPGVARGEGLTSLTALADVTARKAKSMPVTSGQPSEQLVASIRNDFSHSVDNHTKRSEMKDLISYLTGPDKQAALVAGGGWCAPSETRYDFFNIACESGMIDLPTFGVTRGGITFPVSPSLADALSGGTAFADFAATLSNTSTPFLWTEADDIAAATGSPTKPCIRVPCPDFDEERLEAYGYCLTAGNLTDDAYPEATQNTLVLLMKAHAHVINARLIALMLARSTAALPISGGAVTDSAAPRIYNAVGLAATDYRARYGMCIDDVLEVVLPYWVRDVIQADLAWKAGVELGDIPLSEVNRYFTARNIAVQWVNDWQVRGASQFGNATAMAAWPTTADFLIYAAGTFIHGNGMSLDLGVIRDSVLNETNDHTAAWSEEAHLIARVGHESRRYTVGFQVNGSTSALLTGTVRV